MDTPAVKNGKSGPENIRRNCYGNSHMSFVKTTIQMGAIQLIVNLCGDFSSAGKKWKEANRNT